jgi:hypothetical protein
MLSAPGHEAALRARRRTNAGSRKAVLFEPNLRRQAERQRKSDRAHQWQLSSM